MGANVVAQFEESLQGVADSHSRTGPAGFEETLSEHLRRPAVGAELPFDGVSLEGTAVTVDPTVRALENAQTGVTPAGLGVANYGTVTVGSRATGNGLVSLCPRRQVAVVAASDIVPDMPAAFERFTDDPGSQVLATGSGATAGAGRRLEGAHDPESLHVIVLET